MNKIIEIYDLYCKTINNCYFYKEKKDEKHLLNEIGVLRGLEQTLKILNIEVAKIEFQKFLEIEKILLK